MLVSSLKIAVQTTDSFVEVNIIDSQQKYNMNLSYSIRPIIMEHSNVISEILLQKNFCSFFTATKNAMQSIPPTKNSSFLTLFPIIKAHQMPI